MTIAEALGHARARLSPASESPELDAELLLAEVLGSPRSLLFARPQQALADQDYGRYSALIERRLQGEPIAYLLGEWSFWTLDLNVNADVLVPRPDTELLVEWALQLMPIDATPRVADLGTGSGAIALALARERPRAQLLATDRSRPALDVARSNAARCGLQNVVFAQGSWLDAVSGRFDLIVSNPPYIAEGDPHLPALQHEPLLALTSGADGLDALREIIAAASGYLQPGAWLLVEHGFDQGAPVRALFAQAGFASVQTRRDLGGCERATGGCRP